MPCRPDEHTRWELLYSNGFGGYRVGGEPDCLAALRGHGHPPKCSLRAPRLALVNMVADWTIVRMMQHRVTCGRTPAR